MAQNPTHYDAIIIGAGHNGLVTACYLARAGWQVLVLERRYLVGGACVTEETFPGYKVSTAAYVNSLFRPEIIRDLRLHDYGFEVLERNPSSFTPFPDGRSLMMGPDAEMDPPRDRQVQHARRGALSEVRGDARARRRRRRADARHDAAEPAAARARATCWRLLRARPRVPAAGRRDAAEAVEILTGPARPILDRWFESERAQGDAGDRRDHRGDGEPVDAGHRYVLFHHVMGETNGRRGRVGLRARRHGRAHAGAGPGRARPRRRDPLRGRGGAHPGRATGGSPAWRSRAATSIRAPVVASNADAHVTFLQLLDPEDAAARVPRRRSGASATRARRSRSTWPSPSCPTSARCPGTGAGPAASRHDPHLPRPGLHRARLRRRQVRPAVRATRCSSARCPRWWIRPWRRRAST